MGQEKPFPLWYKDGDMSTPGAASTSSTLARRQILRLGRVAGGVSCTLGCVVLFGWYSHIQVLLQISPAFVAMAYNTALGFLLCGVGLLSIGRSSSRLARLLGLLPIFLVLALGILTLSEYLFGISVGLDELFMKSYVRSGVTAPGRMAFCTALCFTLIGLFLLCRRLHFPSRSVVTALIGSVVIGLGVIALSGYFTGIMQSYTWGAFTRMAVHTASGFIVLGLGAIAFAWLDDQSEGSHAPRWLPLLIGTGVATVTLCLWQALVVEESAQQALIGRLAAVNTSLSLGALSRGKSLVPFGELVSGLLLAILLSWAIALAQTARRQTEALREAHEVLEMRVAERTEELAEANEALREVAGWQRGFLRDALASVTEGKLRLCDTPDDLPRYGESFYGHPIFLSADSGLHDLRCQARETADLCLFPTERAQDLVTAVNEAGMNAIVHGSGGFARVSWTTGGTIQVRVTDQGVGITMENIPSATLTRGFTTAGTLGHGLKMILQTTDRFWLLTGPTGTVVALEMDRLPPEPLWAQK